MAKAKPGEDPAATNFLRELDGLLYGRDVQQICNSSASTNYPNLMTLCSLLPPLPPGMFILSTPTRRAENLN